MFRFTIRDVLWLTVVAGFAVGWWLDHSRSNRRTADLENSLDSARAEIIVLDDAVETWDRSVKKIETDLAPHGLKIIWNNGPTITKVSGPLDRP